MGKSAGDLAKIGALGLGAYFAGPAIAGAIGGAGAAGAGGGLLGSPLAYSAAVPGVGAEQAAMLAAQTGAFGGEGLAATRAAASAAMPQGLGTMQALQMGGMAQNLMQPSQAGAGGLAMARGMPTPMPGPGGAQQGQFAALAPYQLPGGMALHSMDTARRFRRGMYG